MKINQNEYSEIIKYLTNKTKPDISASLFKKVKDFKLVDNKLHFKDKSVVPKEQINETLRVQYKKLPFGRDKLFKTLQDKYEGISKSDVVEFLNNSQTNQLHKALPKEKVHQPIISKHVLERVQF